MPDVCDLILDDHEILRRRFAELDEQRDGDREVLDVRWSPLADLLELHAATEEEIFYPELLHSGTNAEDETEDAIEDHNKIRDAVRRARGAEPGSEQWWQAVRDAREANSDHMAEEERGALADLRAHDAREERLRLGDQWVAFTTEHAGMRGLQEKDRDAESYMDRAG